MPAITQEQMQERLDEVTAEVEAAAATLAPMNEQYNKLRLGPVRDEAKMAKLVESMHKAEEPLRQLRKEQALLARALGGRSLSTGPGA